MLQNLRRRLYKLKHLLQPKIRLRRPTIIIQRTVWKQFDVSCFDTSVYDIITVDSIDAVAKESRADIVAFIGNVPFSALKTLSGLQWLQIPSHGFNQYDHISLYADPSVTVTNLRDIFCTPIADFCITAFYTFHCFPLRRLLSPAVRLDNTYIDKRRHTVLIYGFGNIGNKIAETFHQHGWQVYGVKRRLPSAKPPYVEKIVSPSEVGVYLPLCDYVINVLPLTDETKNVFDAAFFEKMNSTAIFCNVGRGASVVDADLENAVQRGSIRGAILDACNKYPYHHPNIILTGHTSSISAANDTAFNAFFSQQLKLFVDGGTKDLKNRIPLQ